MTPPIGDDDTLPPDQDRTSGTDLYAHRVAELERLVARHDAILNGKDPRDRGMRGDVEKHSDRIAVLERDRSSTTAAFLLAALATAACMIDAMFVRHGWW